MNVLIVDNDHDTIRLLIETLVELNWQVEFASSELAARQHLHTAWDVVCIDLRLSRLNDENSGPGELRYQGIRLCKSFRDALPHTVLVLYSSAVPREVEGRFEEADACDRNGADVILARSELVNYTGAQVQERIGRKVRQKRDARAAQRPMEWATDLETQCLCEMVGAETVAQLIGKLLPDMAGDRIQALKAGFGGAYVCAVTSKGHSGGAEMHNVLKIGRESVGLGDELRRRPVSGSSFTGVAVVSEASMVADSGRWRGMLIPAVRNGTRLREYLLDTAPDSRAPDTLAALVEDLLTHPSRQSAPAARDEELFALKACAGAEIVEALRELGGWSRGVNVIEKPVLERVVEIVQRLVKGDVVLTRNRRVSMLHGDFHCRNVFVRPGRGCVLIDFARKDLYPRLFDFAALDLDILVSIMGTEGGGGLFLDEAELARWTLFALDQYPFAERVNEAGFGTERWALLRKALLNAVLAMEEGGLRHEYAQALMFHCLRYLRFPTTPPGKRILIVRLLGRLVDLLGF